MRIADSKSGFVNLSISDRRLFNVAISISDSACPSIQNPQSEIDNPQSKVGAAHEIPAFTDQLALARFQDAAALRAILSIADFGLRVPDCNRRFRIRNGKEVFAGSGLLLNPAAQLREVRPGRPSTFGLSDQDNGERKIRFRASTRRFRFGFRFQRPVPLLCLPKDGGSSRDGYSEI